jgi:hypothetical protein
MRPSRRQEWMAIRNLTRGIQGSRFLAKASVKRQPSHNPRAFIPHEKAVGFRAAFTSEGSAYYCRAYAASVRSLNLCSRPANTFNNTAISNIADVKSRPPSRAPEKRQTGVVAGQQSSKSSWIHFPSAHLAKVLAAKKTPLSRQETSPECAMLLHSASKLCPAKHSRLPSPGYEVRLPSVTIVIGDQSTFRTARESLERRRARTHLHCLVATQISASGPFLRISAMHRRT